MSDAASQRRATLAGLVAILLWASLALLTTATGNLPPFQVLAVGFGIAAVLGLLRAGLRGSAGWRELRQPLSAFALSTLALFGYHALYFIALKRAPAVEANLLNYLWPLLIVVFAGLFGGVSVRRAQWLGTGLGLVAAVLLVTRGRSLQIEPSHVPGYVAAPSAAITLACAGVAVLGAVAHLVGEETVIPTAGQWTVLVLMGIGPVGAAFWLWDHGTKRGDIALLGSLSYLAPLLSTLLVVASGRAQAHWIQAVAIALLMIGAWLSVRASRAR